MMLLLCFFWGMVGVVKHRTGDTMSKSKNIIIYTYCSGYSFSMRKTGVLRVSPSSFTRETKVDAQRHRIKKDDEKNMKPDA